MTFYNVLTNVGPHAAGEIIEITPDAEKAGVNADRLVRLGTVEKLDTLPKNVRATPYGESADFDRNASAFPVIGVDGPDGPSPDPIRSENPPTLPEPGVASAAQPVKGKVSNKPEA